MLSIKKTVIKLIFRELRVGIMIGLTCGVLITLIAYIWRGPIIGIVVGISLLLTLIIGTLAGTIIPLLLYRFGVDPAVASGPLITTLNDVFFLSSFISEQRRCFILHAIGRRTAFHSGSCSLVNEYLHVCQRLK